MNQAKPYKPLNNASSDYFNPDGVRVSIPLYLDLPTQKRKDLLNAIRTAVENQTLKQYQPATASGLTVESHGDYNPTIEKYIGMDMSVLRGVLFQRGGLPADLVLRIQAVTGLTVITDAELKKAFTERQKQVLNYIKDNPPTTN